MQQIQLATKNTHQAVHACHTHRTSEGEYQHENHEKHGSYSVYDLGVRLETDWFAHVGSQLHTLLQHRMHPALRYTKQGGGAKSQIQLRIGIRKDTVPVVGFRAGFFFFNAFFRQQSDRIPPREGGPCHLRTNYTPSADDDVERTTISMQPTAILLAPDTLCLLCIPSHCINRALAILQAPTCTFSVTIHARDRLQDVQGRLHHGLHATLVSMFRASNQVGPQSRHSFTKQDHPRLKLLSPYPLWQGPGETLARHQVQDVRAKCSTNLLVTDPTINPKTIDTVVALRSQGVARFHGLQRKAVAGHTVRTVALRVEVRQCILSLEEVQ